MACLFWSQSNYCLDLSLRWPLPNGLVHRFLVAAMAAAHAMAAGRKHLWSHSFAGAEDPQVRVQAGCARAKSAFWLSLPIFSLVHQHLPCKVGMLWMHCILSLGNTVLREITTGNTVVFSGDLACPIRAHACSSAVFTLCSSASLLYVALLVFCKKVLYLWFLCSYVPVALLFAL
jgi:hypothetical protein